MSFSVKKGTELLHCIKDERFERQLKRFCVEYIPPVRLVSISTTHNLRSGVFSWQDTMTLLCPQRLTFGKTETIKPKEKLNGHEAPIVVKVEKKEVTKPDAKPTPPPMEKKQDSIQRRCNQAKTNPKANRKNKKHHVRNIPIIWALMKTIFFNSNQLNKQLLWKTMLLHKKQKRSFPNSQL